MGDDYYEGDGEFGDDGYFYKEEEPEGDEGEQEKNDDEIEEEEIEDLMDEHREKEIDETVKETKIIIVPENERISRPFLSKYEYIGLLSSRINQLNAGEEPFIDDDYKGRKDVSSIAKFEILNKLIPAIIDRKLPDGRIERWRLEELQLSKFFN